MQKSWYSSASWNAGKGFYPDNGRKGSKGESPALEARKYGACLSTAIRVCQGRQGGRRFKGESGPAPVLEAARVISECEAKKKYHHWLGLVRFGFVWFGMVIVEAVWMAGWRKRGLETRRPVRTFLRSELSRRNRKESYLGRMSSIQVTLDRH